MRFLGILEQEKEICLKRYENDKAIGNIMKKEHIEEISLAVVHSYVLKELSLRFVGSAKKAVLDTMKKYALLADNENEGVKKEDVVSAINNKNCDEAAKYLVTSEEITQLGEKLIVDLCEIVRVKLAEIETAPTAKKKTH